MQDPTSLPSAADLARQRRNHDRLLAALTGGEHAGGRGNESRCLRLSLERFVVDRQEGTTVPFAGQRGVGALVAATGRLLGDEGADGAESRTSATGEVPVGAETIGVEVGVGPAGQLVSTVGPAHDVRALGEALATLERQVHLASREVGRDVDLIAQGYNPTVEAPSDLPLVPLARHTLTEAHLSRHGDKVRDAMRATAGTVVGIDYGGQREAAESYRVATALSPILAFLTDNALRFRGEDPHDCGRMLRQSLWSQAAPALSSPLPDAFGPSFGYRAYVAWLERQEPAWYVGPDGHDLPCGEQPLSAVMMRDELSDAQVAQLLRALCPEVGLDGRLVLRCADSLPARLALGYAAFAKGLFCDDKAFELASVLVSAATPEAVESAARDLARDGWGAKVYGRDAADLVSQLVRIAREGLAEGERDCLDSITQVWEVGAVPRDLLLDTWDRKQAPSEDAGGDGDDTEDQTDDEAKARSEGNVN